MTKAEAYLWKYVLRNRKLKDLQFRRQRPVLNYIADFICLELKLIIEVDGSSHRTPDAVAKDIIRENHLIAKGFRIIRLDDEDVLRDINAVRNHLGEAIDAIRNSK